MLYIELKLQTCSLVQPENNNIELMNTDSQSNSNDCGLYALVVDTELVLEGNPVICEWDDSRMRQHLWHCLERGEMARFPVVKLRQVASGTQVKRSIRKKK